MDKTKRAIFFKLLEGLIDDENDDDESSTEVKVPHFVTESIEYLEKLKKRTSDLSNLGEFKAGDIVVWKKGLKNKRYPAYSQPGIVIKKYDEVIVDNDPTRKEPLNIQLGFITEEDEFIVFNYDSSRFEIFRT